METLTLPGGRTLEYLVEGAPSALPFVLHHGTPSAAVRLAPVFDAAATRGLRTVMISRPGYGSSSPQPGRRVADAASDTAAVLDAIGASSFVTAGWSGGGPHALACAALLPDRCRAAATIAGVAPYDAAGLDWPAGMGDENVAEFGAAVAGQAELEKFLAEATPEMTAATPATIIDAFGGLLSEVDRQALSTGFAEYLVLSARHALSAGYAGWRDDDLAFVADWGFRLDDIGVPVAIWQGDQDRMVPGDHGRWLAANVRGAVAHFAPGEGHLTLINNIETVIDDLRAA